MVPASADPVAIASGNAVSIRLQVTSADNSASLGTNKALTGTLVADVTVAAKPEYDNTIRHKLTGLNAGQYYYYQFIAGDVRSNVGRFKTAPAATDAVSGGIKFAYMTCQDWSVNHWGAFTDVLNENPDFIIHLGDYIYETVGASFQQGLVESVHDQLKLPDGTALGAGDGGGVYATTLADYRYLYKKYRTDKRLQAVHERFPYIAIWDDHEFSDDCWGDAETYASDLATATASSAKNPDGTAAGSGIEQPARRTNANQAWFEFMPADLGMDTFDASKDWKSQIKIYRSLQFGTLMNLIMTDERLYRTDHAIPETATGGSKLGSRYLVPLDSLEAMDKGSMLGADQVTWWQGQMQSTATWKLWGNEVSLLRMGLDATNAVGTLVALKFIASTTGQAAITSLAGSIPATDTATLTAVIGSAAPSLLTASTPAIPSAEQTAIATKASAAASAVTAQGGSAAVAIATAAQVIVFAVVQYDVVTSKGSSQYIIGAGLQTALANYWAKFLLNCDQWDGYNNERKTLMSYLKSNNIKNVVALTGDIHSFYAGTVNDDFDATGGGTPVMVDLVTAGISSDSFFSYMRDAALSLDPNNAALANLVAYPLTGTGIPPMPLTVNGTANTTKFYADLLDYTMGKAAPADVNALFDQMAVQLRGALAAAGTAEAALDPTMSALKTGLTSASAFNTDLLALAQQLSSLNSNPWMKYLNTDAQGYTVVTLTPSTLTATFKQVHKVINGVAPTAPLIARKITATVNAGTPDVTITLPAALY